MNQKILYILIIITYLIPQITWCQGYSYVSFPDSGAIWSEVYHPGWAFDFEGSEVYERFTVIGEDTIIQGKLYNKLYLFYDTVFSKSNATYIGGLREDTAKRVYFIVDTILHSLKPDFSFWKKEALLYDFSLNTGDTLKLGNSDYSYNLVVQNIDSVLIGDTYRKSFHFSYNNQIPQWANWIEGIGNVNGLFYTSGDRPTDGSGSVLICFQQNNTILYFDSRYNECMPYKTGTELGNKSYSGMHVYPNPVTGDYLRFHFPNPEIIRLEIFDVSGKKIDCIDVSSQPEFDYPVLNYRKGVYFYFAEGSDGKGEYGRFIIQ